MRGIYRDAARPPWCEDQVLDGPASEEKGSKGGQTGCSMTAGSSANKTYSSQFKNNCFAEMWSSSEQGSYLRLIDCFITQL